ncbi:MAG: hypothetical protein QXT74_03510 [Candidatus Nezhaarchaeales archaeon]
MSEDKACDEEESKNIKLTAFNLLRLLKFFYSFKELERRIGVPSQVLWRYVTLRATPERDTAQKILARIEEQKLVEEAISEVILESKEPWLLLSNPGILELSALKLVEEFGRSKAEVVLSTPDPYSAALAAVASIYLKARLCIPSRILYSNSVIVESYEASSGVLDVIAIPRKSVPNKSKVLITTMTMHLPPLGAAINLVLKSGSELVGVFSVVGGKEEIKELTNLLRNRIGREVPVVTLVEGKLLTGYTDAMHTKQL